TDFAGHPMDQNQNGINGEPFVDPQNPGDAYQNTLAFTVNQAPTISSIGLQNTTMNTPVGPINFTVGDAETPAGNLIVSVPSSNQLVLPDANILLDGSGANRNIKLTPAAGQLGTAFVTITVTDAGGRSTSMTFELAVNGNAVLPFSDDFNRPDDPILGAVWQENLGDFRVVSNRGLSNAALSIATLRGVFEANAFVQADVALASGSSSMGLVLRHSGPGDTNMYAGLLVGNGGSFSVQIWRNLGGSWTLLSSKAVPIGVGTLRFQAVGP